jgi:hypothetical protein
MTMLSSGREMNRWRYKGRAAPKQVVKASHTATVQNSTAVLPKARNKPT